jgi:hypothetical protein
MSIKYIVQATASLDTNLTGSFVTPKDFNNECNFVVLVGAGGSGGGGTYDIVDGAYAKGSGAGGGGGAFILAENIQLQQNETYNWRVPGKNNHFSTTPRMPSPQRAQRADSTFLQGPGVDLEAESGEPGDSGWNGNSGGSGGDPISLEANADRIVGTSGGRGGNGSSRNQSANPLFFNTGGGGGGAGGSNGNGGWGGAGRYEPNTSDGRSDALGGGGGGSNGGARGTSSKPNTFSSITIIASGGSYNIPYRPEFTASFAGCNGAPGLRLANGQTPADVEGFNDIFEGFAFDQQQYFFPLVQNNVFNGNIGTGLQADPNSGWTLNQLSYLQTCGGASGGAGSGSGGNCSDIRLVGGGGGGAGTYATATVQGGEGANGLLLIVWKSTTDGHLNFTI